MDTALEQPSTLLNAHLSFLDTRLVLIHIPLDVYPLFVNSIIQLLLHNNRHSPDGDVIEPKRPWMFWYPLVHVSITSQACSVVCPEQEAERLFVPILRWLNPKCRDSVSVSRERYSAVLISGEGLDASQRVLDLTGPLALAGISIFFITSYYADFILVPLRARARVIRALKDRGFVFEAELNGDAGHMTNSAAQGLPLGHLSPSISTSGFDLPSPVTSPTPTSIPELQSKTFAMLQSYSVTPQVDESIGLVTCAGVKDSTATALATNDTEGKLHFGIAKCLTAANPPRFLAITLTDAESVSVTLEKELLSSFHNDGEDLLLGKDGPEQVAITLDLDRLPPGSTGIVCGVASRLRDHMAHRVGDIFNMSYLSTTGAGHVIVDKDEVRDAMLALRGVEQNGQAAD